MNIYNEIIDKKVVTISRMATRNKRDANKRSVVHSDKGPLSCLPNEQTTDARREDLLFRNEGLTSVPIVLSTASLVSTYVSLPLSRLHKGDFI